MPSVFVSSSLLYCPLCKGKSKLSLANLFFFPSFSFLPSTSVLTKYSIKMPQEYIDWTVPEGGGGPSYTQM